MRRLPSSLALLLFLLLLLAGPAGAASPARALPPAQDAWAAAIRWNNFDGATNLIDPALRAAQTPGPLESERYRQVQISSYRDVGASVDAKAGQAVRDIEIGVVNRHTQVERTVRYREVWRWDAKAKTWWITSGLPDLWAGK